MNNFLLTDILASIRIAYETHDYKALTCIEEYLENIITSQDQNYTTPVIASNISFLTSSLSKLSLSQKQIYNVNYFLINEFPHNQRYLQGQVYVFDLLKINGLIMNIRNIGAVQVRNLINTFIENGIPFDTHISASDELKLIAVISSNKTKSKALGAVDIVTAKELINTINNLLNNKEFAFSNLAIAKNIQLLTKELNNMMFSNCQINFLTEYLRYKYPHEKRYINKEFYFFDLLRIRNELCQVRTFGPKRALGIQKYLTSLGLESSLVLTPNDEAKLLCYAQNQKAKLQSEAFDYKVKTQLLALKNKIN